MCRGERDEEVDLAYTSTYPHESEYSAPELAVDLIRFSIILISHLRFGLGFQMSEWWSGGDANAKL